MYKNVASQGVYLLAWDSVNGVAYTGGAATITGNISKDGAAPAATATANPTEIGGGTYWQPLSQAESNADALCLYWSSTTTGVQVDPVFVTTTPGTNAGVNANLATWLGSAPAALSSSGYVQAMLLRWLTDNAAGTPNALASNLVPADEKAINAVSTSSVTTVNANIGATQPVNFTGTGASALVKSDTLDWNSVGVTGMPMPTYAQPTGFLAATFPATVASPTNITAGTITTVTNLTNAPTAGDFTAAMKTSLNAATPASVTGAVGSVTAAVTVGTNNDKTGYDVTSMNGHTTVGGHNWYDTIRYISATTAGLLPSGAGSGTEQWQDFAGINAVKFTVDASGDRTAAVYT